MALVTGLEPYYPTILKALAGFGKKAALDGLKKWRGAARNAQEKEIADQIKDFEFGKSVEEKIEQRVTAALQKLKLAHEDWVLLLQFESDNQLKEEISDAIFTNRLNPDLIVALWLKNEARLRAKAEDLSHLAAIFVDSIDSAISASPEASRIAALRGQRHLQHSIDSLEESMGGKLEGQDGKIGQLVEVTKQLKLLLEQRMPQVLQGEKTGASLSDDRVASLNEKRFERAKDRMLNASVAAAEIEFRTLVEDLEAVPESAKSLLLFRAQSNLAACLWELDRTGEAVVAYQKAIALRPDDWRSKRHASIIKLAERDYEGSLRLLQGLIEEQPTEVHLVCNASALLRKLGRAADAALLLKNHSFEDAEVFASLASVHIDLENFPEAEAAARKALAIEDGLESALGALSAAILTPIVNKRKDKITLDLSPFAEDEPRIREAIACMECAVATAKQKSRKIATYEAMLNLPLAFLLLNDTANAVRVGRELDTLAPKDLVALGNLFCAEVRAENWEAGLGCARRLFELEASVVNWEKVAYCFFRLGRPLEVIRFWESSTAAHPELAESQNVKANYADALSKTHRTQEAYNLLKEEVRKMPDSVGLLAALGQISEELGKIPEATELFAKAEKITDGQDAQITVDCAEFHYRQGHWEQAIVRFESIGADAISSPLFSRFVICTYNARQFSRCVKLCEDSLASPHKSPDVAYILGARCHFFSGNVRRAKELLDTAVLEGRSNTTHERKLLAFAYWRMDEAQIAYDIASKALQPAAPDRDLLLLLSVSSTRLGRFTDGVNYAHRAILLAPEDAEAHKLFVQAINACSEAAQKAMPAELRAKQVESISCLVACGYGVFAEVKRGDEKNVITSLVRENSERIDDAEKLYQQELVPLGLFARQTGRSLYQAWRKLHTSKLANFNMQGGHPDDQTRQVMNCRGDTVSIDVPSLFTLALLGRLELLKQMFKSIHVHSAYLDAVLSDLRGLEVTIQNSKPAAATAESRRSVELLTFVKDFLRSDFVDQVGTFDEDVPAGTVREAIETCGIASIIPVVVAKKKGSPLFSDDRALRVIAGGENVASFCTQALLRVAVEQGCLSAEAYQNDLLTLIENNYWFISEDGNTLRAAYLKSGGEVSSLAKKLVNSINDPRYKGMTCIPALAQFILFVWDSSTEAKVRDLWLHEIWSAIERAKERERAAYLTIIHIASNCLLRPKTFFEIANWLDGVVSFIKRNRSWYRAIVRMTSEAVQRAHRRMNLDATAALDWHFQSILQKIK